MQLYLPIRAGLAISDDTAIMRGSVKVLHVEWDEGNLTHFVVDNADREISPEDAEEVIFALPNPTRAIAIAYKGQEQILFFGRTTEGRCLLVAAEPFGQGGVRPITARDMTKNEARKYLGWCRTVKR